MKVIVWPVNGNIDEIDDVDEVQVKDGQLHLYKDVPEGSNGYHHWTTRREHLGSYPLQNIWKYLKIDTWFEEMTRDSKG